MIVVWVFGCLRSRGFWVGQQYFSGPLRAFWSLVVHLPGLAALVLQVLSQSPLSPVNHVAHSRAKSPVPLGAPAWHHCPFLTPFWRHTCLSTASPFLLPVCVSILSGRMIAGSVGGVLSPGWFSDQPPTNPSLRLCLSAENTRMS